MNDQLDLPLYFTFSSNLHVVMSLYGCIFGFFDRIVGSSETAPSSYIFGTFRWL